jgi:hypothetical protein
MGRRRVVVAAVVAVGLVLAAGCSGDDDGAGDDGGTSEASTTSGPTTATTSTTATEPDTASTGSATDPGAGTGGGGTPGPTVAEAGGWRLAVTEPAAGAAVASPVTVCAEVAGTTREPAVALEVTLLARGADDGGQPVRADTTVGRRPVEVTLPDAPPGPSDLRVQLIADGEPVDGVAVTVPVTLGEVPAAALCE